MDVSIPDDGIFPARASEGAFDGMVETLSEGIRVRHDPGLDRILVQDALNTMDASRRVYDGLFGGGPNHVVTLDIFPTARRFMVASGIPSEAVRTTGVIALSKWNRLLITSPRATAGGYGWMDTAAHEYIHLVVSARTKDKAPVWLQEGLAKYFEHTWRESNKDFLTQQQKSMLSQALIEDAFVPFEKFARSMAYLDSGQEAALAYAQVATMVEYLVHTSGVESIVPLMDRIGNGEKSEAVISNLCGHTDFAQFQVGWKEFISNKPAIKAELVEGKISLDGEGGDFADDPVLNTRTDLARFVRIGDLLMEQGFPKAALVEYRKADDATEPPSPTALAKMAICQRELGASEKSLSLIDRALMLYPDNARVLRTAGELYDEDPNKSAEYWHRAHEVNPYHIPTQQALVSFYSENNALDKREHHANILLILKQGGARIPSDKSNDL
jgi:tetratricopeptide (TPR) repeat protein